MLCYSSLICFFISVACGKLIEYMYMYIMRKYVLALALLYLVYRFNLKCSLIIISWYSHQLSTHFTIIIFGLIRYGLLTLHHSNYSYTIPMTFQRECGEKIENEEDREKDQQSTLNNFYLVRCMGWWIIPRGIFYTKYEWTRYWMETEGVNKGNGI